MLREALSASIDDARLDHGHDHEFVPDDAKLGAELDGAPPEVRAAAVRRSRRIPEPSIIPAAWASLPLDVRDKIGVMALTQSFYSLTAGLREQSVTLEAGWRCEEWGCAALNGITAAAVEALPDFFGTPDTEPLWALADGVAVVFPAQSHPSPLTQAIADHQLALAALGAAPPWTDDNPDEAWLALSTAEHETFKAVLAAPYAHPADAEALVAHLRPLVGEEQRHPILDDLGDVTCGVLARVLDVFAGVLKGEAVAAGRLA